MKESFKYDASFFRFCHHYMAITEFDKSYVTFCIQYDTMLELEILKM